MNMQHDGEQPEDVDCFMYLVLMWQIMEDMKAMQ